MINKDLNLNLGQRLEQLYSDRASAEQAALLVMDQTELNGLWVLKNG